MNKLEQVFEWLLWHSRLAIIPAVIASLASSFGLFYLTTIDIVHLLYGLMDYASIDGEAKVIARADAIAEIVAAIDGYLLATILIIFSLGLYELFISKIDIAEKSERASKVLFIRSLDDLKDKLAKVIMMILVVTFFSGSIKMHFEKPLDLVYYAIGICLVSLALFLVRKSDEMKS